MVRAHRVEIAQVGDPPGAVGDFQVAQHLLAHQFGLAVGVGGRQRERLGDGHGMRIAVHRGRRAEHQLPHVGMRHGRAQRDQPAHVVVVIGQRLLDRFPHRLQRGEVDDGRDARAGEQVIEQPAVADIALHELRRLGGDLLDAGQHGGAAVAQIVQADHLVAGVQQFNPGVRGDIAGGAGQQDGFVHRVKGSRRRRFVPRLCQACARHRTPAEQRAPARRTARS